jgi:hypothetical protein
MVQDLEQALIVTSLEEGDRLGTDTVRGVSWCQHPPEFIGP